MKIELFQSNSEKSEHKGALMTEKKVYKEFIMGMNVLLIVAMGHWQSNNCG